MASIADDWGIREWAEWKRQPAFDNIADTTRDIPSPELVEEVRELLAQLDRETRGMRGSGFRASLNERLRSGRLDKAGLERTRDLLSKAISQETSM